MPDLIHIADRVLNRPLLITPDKAQVILSVLAGRIGVNSPAASRFEGESIVRDPVTGKADFKPYRVTKKGVGIITITGSLVARGAWVGASSGLTSYEGIQHQLKTAENDDAVRTAIVDLHTPGGEAVLAFETAARVRELASKKRTIAVVNGLAASAGYAIASGASEVVTAETGVSGSIGVVWLHADFSRALDRDGISPTLIHAGAHKVDGNPFEPLSEEVRGAFQAEVDAIYEAFISTVAKGRGSRMTAAAARKTEARTFIGKAAVEVGLADRVGTFESVLQELSTRGGGRKSPNANSRSTRMANNDDDAPETGITKAAHDAAVANAKAEGQKAGATAERERFKAVMNSEAYKGREASAHHMLTTTDLTAEAITGVLAGIPAQEKQAVSGERSKDATGGLVVESGASTPSKEAPSASWSKSIEKANARVR